LLRVENSIFRLFRFHIQYDFLITEFIEEITFSISHWFILTKILILFTDKSMALLQPFPKSHQSVKKRMGNAFYLNVGYRLIHGHLSVGHTMELQYRTPVDTR
jgi:hypothetical protein